MKFLYIANARIPTEKAHGYQICKMCEEFARAGIDIELWVPGRKNSIKDDLYNYYGLERNFTIKKISNFDFLGFSPILEKYFFRLQSIFYCLKLFFKKIDKDSIIYTRSPEIVWTFAMRGKKVIFEDHQWTESKERFYKFLIGKAFKIVVVTAGIKDIFVKNGFKKENILVAPDGVDLKKFDINLTKEQARRQLKLPQEKIILGYTGRFKTMEQDKGIKDILKALKIIARKHENIFFIAVGGGNNDIKYYQKIAVELGVQNNTILLGRVDMDRLAIYQKACDGLLMPFPFTKHYAHYMSPLKMFEYMASKRPIIASGLPSIREILNENNAVLVRPGDYKDLADGIEKVIINKELSGRLAEQAFKDAQEYSWEKRAERILDFIIKQNY